MSINFTIDGSWLCNSRTVKRECRSVGPQASPG